MTLAKCVPLNPHAWVHTRPGARVHPVAAALVVFIRQVTSAVDAYIVSSALVCPNNKKNKRNVFKVVPRTCIHTQTLKFVHFLTHTCVCMCTHWWLTLHCQQKNNSRYAQKGHKTYRRGRCRRRRLRQRCSCRSHACLDMRPSPASIEAISLGDVQS